jgi:hypothetical protein
MDGTGGGDGDGVGVRCNVERGMRFVLDWLVLFVGLGGTGDMLCSG